MTAVLEPYVAPTAPLWELSRPTAMTRSVAERWDRELEGATAQEVLLWARDVFGSGFALTASMADGLLTHIAGRAIPGVDVLFLDTGYHFAETLGTRDAVAATTAVNVVTVSPPLTRAQHEAEYGRLYEIDTDMCCAIRKTWPLDKAVRPYTAWASGNRRSESATRAATPVVGWDDRRKKVKINPLATWSDEQVEAYCAEHGVLVNPLRELNFLSIGCEPCTRPVAEGEDPRAGRWSGSSKTECGIHL